MRIAVSRTISLTLAAALLGWAVACSSGKPAENSHSGPLLTYADNGVVPLPLVYKDQAYCVYPDDMDDLSMEAVSNYCSEVAHPATQAPVAERYWIEAEEPGHFDGPDPVLSQVAWNHYLTYLHRWFGALTFARAYMGPHLGQYMARHNAYKQKYGPVIDQLRPKAIFITRAGEQLNERQVVDRGYVPAPRSCKLIAYNGESGITILIVASSPSKRPKSAGSTGSSTSSPTIKATPAQRSSPTGVATPSTQPNKGGVVMRPLPAPTRTC